MSTTTGGPGPSAGWYSSPGTARQRYWNGEEWTEHSAPQEKATALVWVGYVLAILFPPVGLLLGTIAATRQEKAINRHGVWVILLSTIGFVAWIVVWGVIAANNGGSSGSCFNVYRGYYNC